jgi:CheY-like chemotaxis protein
MKPGEASLGWCGPGPFGDRPASVEAEPFLRPGAPLILVVDDDQHAREGLSEFLVGVGFRVTEAADGPEALRKAMGRRPDAILLDLAIPRLDGWTVARTLKADPVLAEVPVIACSGLDYPDQRLRAVESGCDTFIAKPRDPVKVVDVVKALLAPRRPVP